MTTRSVLVVGASLAGVRTAEALRSSGFEGRITLVGDEAGLPYDRPPLSKSYLAGRDDLARITLRTRETLDADRIELRTGVAATALFVQPRSVGVTVGGEEVEADALVIATGCRTRRPMFAVDHPSVHELRRVDDSDRLRPLLSAGRRVVVIGAGFIGAEVAWTASTLGCEVTVVEALPVPLSRQLGDEMGAAVAALHERNGVRLRTGAVVDSVTPAGVRLSDGTLLAADVVVIGIGVQPNTEWLAGSGIEVRDGVCADPTLRARRVTGEPLDHVVAVGDVVRWTNPLFDEEMRIEHWTNAADTALHAAATLLGAREPFEPVPYFWSDQYGRKIQFFGRATAFDEVRVVQGSTSDDSWLACYRRSDRIVAALGIHKMRAVMQLRGAIATRTSWSDALALVS